MKHVVAALAAVIAVAGQPAYAAPPDDKGADRARVYVAYKDGQRGPAQRALAAVGAEVHHDFPGLGAYAASIPAVAREALARNPAVAYVEEDPKRYPMAQTVPYGIPMVQADQVDAPSGGGGAMVCIIDSGYDGGHPDLPGATGSNDPGGAGAWDTDGSGHGTHVAGTIAAVNNSTGVVGVTSEGSGNVPLHIVKVFGDDGTWAYSSSLVAALGECEQAAGGANLVVNMSLGGSFKSRTEDRAFSQAYNRGVLSVAAAGNDGNTRKSYPASYDSVVSVAAVDEQGIVASFSQQNDQVELSGPGVLVLSTVPVGTGTEQSFTVAGTSYSAIAMDGSPFDSATGALVDCGLGSSTCQGASGQVCLISRGDISFSDKVLACEAGGGVAAVIYNNEPGPLLGTLGGVATNIPSLGISQADGESALDSLGASATVTIAVSDYAYFDGSPGLEPGGRRHQR
ncbi:MAG: S8 family serine peptidase [Gammaproteobacteria bacterium]